MASRLLSRDFLYRFHDVRIGAAAADVAAHPFSDFGGVQIGCGIEIAAHMAGHARLDLVKHRHGRAYLTGRAIAALKCLMRSDEHTSEIQSLMRISYAVFCLIKNNILISIRYKTRHINPQ